VHVDRIAEAEVHRHLQALEHTQAIFPSPPTASKLHYLHYLQQLMEALAGRPSIGFRFAVTKAVDEKAPPGLDQQIFYAALNGKLDELLGLCLEWAGHAVIDAYKKEVCQDTNTNTNTNTNICLLAYSPNKQTNASCSCFYCE